MTTTPPEDPTPTESTPTEPTATTESLPPQAEPSVSYGTEQSGTDSANAQALNLESSASRVRNTISVPGGKASIAIGGAVLLAGGFLSGYALTSSSSDDAPNRGGFTRTGGQFPGGEGQRGGQNGARGGGAGNAVGNATAGTVTSVDGNTITLKTLDGRTVTITAGSATKVTVNTSGSVSDLASGDTVVVQGTTNSDGNVTADSIAEGGIGGLRGGPAPAK